MLYPLFAMVFLTFCVMLTTFITRVQLVRAGKIKLDYFQLFQGEKANERVIVTTRHYANIFEVPVLFYTASVLAIALQIDCNILPIVAWCFVGFRVVHTFIHLTYNKVQHRVMAFMASNICVFAMWGIIAYQTL
ncbi:MAG: MAPEG family protein [Lentisphaeraceae bacterium]|nr:MAPEG family protein [Lentisphaeraceae bacterium]